MSEKMTRTELKEIAQKAIMHGIGNVLGYWDPANQALEIPDDQEDELREIMPREADRLAKVFGYDRAWSN